MIPASDGDPRHDICDAPTTVQVGPMAAIDLRCILERWSHNEGIHYTSRSFGIVHMTARWAGEFGDDSL